MKKNKTFGKLLSVMLVLIISVGACVGLGVATKWGNDWNPSNWGQNFKPDTNLDSDKNSSLGTVGDNIKVDMVGTLMTREHMLISLEKGKSYTIDFTKIFPDIDFNVAEEEFKIEFFITTLAEPKDVIESITHIPTYNGTIVLNKKPIVTFTALKDFDACSLVMSTTTPEVFESTIRYCYSEGTNGVLSLIYNGVDGFYTEADIKK